MKIKPILTAAMCLTFMTVLIGCAESPPNGDISAASKSSVPHTDVETESSEPEIDTVAAKELRINGGLAAYIPADTNPEDVIGFLCLAKRNELEQSGANVKSVSLQSTVELNECQCLTEDIVPADEASRAVFSDFSLSFMTVITEKESQSVAFQTVYENSSSYYEGTSVTKTEGSPGEIILTYEVTCSDGDEISRTLINEETVKPATNKVVLVGTKKSTASTGSYAWPLKIAITVTSQYGGRTLSGSYDFHLGVDLRAATGTSVYAADGGKVIYAGVMGSYGNLVKIQHDNGDVTYYAHLSSIAVKVGDRVYKGQYIAKSGATGNVTGPHLHFEIRINGSTVNPLKYLPAIS